MGMKVSVLSDYVVTLLSLFAIHLILFPFFKVLFNLVKFLENLLLRGLDLLAVQPEVPPRQLAPLDDSTQFVCS